MSIKDAASKRAAKAMRMAERILNPTKYHTSKKRRGVRSSTPK
jgi:hypothetical protein